MKRLFPLFVVFAFACTRSSVQTEANSTKAAASTATEAAAVESGATEAETTDSERPQIELSASDREFLDFLALDTDAWVDSSGTYQFRVEKNEAGHYLFKGELILDVWEDGILKTMYYESFLAGEPLEIPMVCAAITRVNDNTVELAYYDQCARLSDMVTCTRRRASKNDYSDEGHEAEPREPAETVRGIGLFLFRSPSSKPVTLLNKAFGPEVSVTGSEYSLTFSPPSKEWDLYVNFLEFELLHAIAIDSTVANTTTYYLIEYSPGVELYVRSDAGIFVTWEEYLLHRVFAVSFDESSNPLRDAPSDDGAVVKVPGLATGILEVKGDWIRLGGEDCVGTAMDRQLWIRWRRGNELLVDFAYIC